MKTIAWRFGSLRRRPSCARTLLLHLFSLRLPPAIFASSNDLATLRFDRQSPQNAMSVKRFRVAHAKVIVNFVLQDTDKPTALARAALEFPQRRMPAKMSPAILSYLRHSHPLKGEIKALSMLIDPSARITLSAYGVDDRSFFTSDPQSPLPVAVDVEQTGSRRTFAAV
jgi:hypothetical protein